MQREGMLAQLMAQANDADGKLGADGKWGADLVTLRAIVEEASELGAQRMLARMGLDDARAQDDLHELRQLLSAWRDAKASAWRATVDWLVRGSLALLLIGIAFRLGVKDLLK